MRLLRSLCMFKKTVPISELPKLSILIERRLSFILNIPIWSSQTLVYLCIGPTANVFCFGMNTSIPAIHGVKQKAWLYSYAVQQRIYLHCTHTHRHRVKPSNRFTSDSKILYYVKILFRRNSLLEGNIKL